MWLINAHLVGSVALLPALALEGRKRRCVTSGRDPRPRARRFFGAASPPWPAPPSCRMRSKAADAPPDRAALDVHRADSACTVLPAMGSLIKKRRKRMRKKKHKKLLRKTRHQRRARK